MSLRGIIRHPSAFLPLCMSALAIATIFVHLARFGPAPQPDEGTAAHLWQLLMAGQLPLIAFFSMRWLPESPRQAIPVLAMQAAAVIAALAPVYILKW